jgi:hypothetical protein
LLAPSLTLNSPVLIPVRVSVKATLIVHLLLAAKLVVHVVVETAKSPVVEIAMLVSARNASRLLQNTVFGTTHKSCDLAA